MELAGGWSPGEGHRAAVVIAVLVAAAAAAAGDEASLLDIITLAVAFAGLALSLVLAVLQYLAHRRAGSRVKVELLFARAGPDQGGVITYAKSGTLDETDIAKRGYTVPLVAVIARNLGHGSTTIESVAVDLGQGVMSISPDPRWGAVPPERIDAEGSARFYFDRETVVEIASQLKQPWWRSKKRQPQARGKVTLGTGRTRHSGRVSLPWWTPR